MINARRAAGRGWGRARPWRPRTGRGAGRVEAGRGHSRPPRRVTVSTRVPSPGYFPVFLPSPSRGVAPRIPQSSPAPPVAPAPSEGSTCSERAPCPVFEGWGRGFPAAVGSGSLRSAHHCLRQPIAATPRAHGGPARGRLRGRGAVTARSGSPGPRTPSSSPRTGRPRPPQRSRR